MRASASATSQFDEQVAVLTAERGDSVAIAEVGEIVGALMQSLSGDLSAVQLKLSQELSSLVDYIHQARSEMRSLRPEEIRYEHIPQATDELDAVVQVTATATTAFLDAAEELEKLSGEVPEAAEQLTSIATKIYEASNFQDLTGQRITKVVKTLHHIEARIAAMAEALGHEAEANAIRAVADMSQTESDADLLNGPQLPQHANSQAEIDALLASFD